MKGIGQFDAQDSEGNYIGDPNAGGTSSASLPYYNIATAFGSSPTSIRTPPFFGNSTTPGGDFWTALTQGLKSATSILGVRYAVPQLSPGQVITTGPGGTSFMSQASTGGAMQLPTVGVGIGTIALVGGAVVLLVFMISRRR